MQQRKPTGHTPPFGYEKPDPETLEEALRLLNEARSRNAIDRTRLRKIEGDQAAQAVRIRQLEDENALLAHVARTDDLTEMLCRTAHEAFSAHVIVDMTGRILYSNPAASDLFGGELIGSSVHEHVLSKIERRYRSPDENTKVQLDPRLYGKSLWQRVIVEQSLPRVTEGILLHAPFKEGVRHDVSFSMTRMKLTDGKVRAHIEITDIEAVVKDKTTGLLLQNSLINAFSRKIVERERDPELAKVRKLVFLFCDLDNFKRYNEDFGYDAGNKVLRESAAAITGQLRETDMACRWFFGDELAALIEFISTGTPEGDLRAVREIGDRVDAAIRRIDIIWEGQPLPKVTASIGVATWRAGEAYEQVVERAIEAAKASKTGGKGRVTQEMVPLEIPAYLRSTR